MDNLIIIAVIAGILLGVVSYIRREKKRGVRCIGCPDAKTCSGHCQGCTGCSAGK